MTAAHAIIDNVADVSHSRAPLLLDHMSIFGVSVVDGMADGR